MVISTVLDEWKVRHPSAFVGLPDYGPDIALVQPTFIALMLAHGHLDRAVFRRGQRFHPDAYTAPMVALIKSTSLAAVATLDADNHALFERIVPNEIATV
jgi:hypothetical protein